MPKGTRKRLEISMSIELADAWSEIEKAVEDLREWPSYARVQQVQIAADRYFDAVQRELTEGKQDQIPF